MTTEPFAERLAAVYRQEVGRCTATLVRVLGDVEQAEDAVADAFAIAAERWAIDGIPANPGGWITTTARNRAIDRLRRESTRRDRERQADAMRDPEPPAPPPDLGPIEAVPDDQLRLIFLCCHPAIGADAQVALTLRLLGGLTTTEIARAFLVPEPTMGQRLSRAKRKIRDTHLAYRIPEPSQLPSRLDPVLATIYLIATEGHTATAGDDLLRPQLTDEAIGMARMLVDLLPSEPEPIGLLALLLLTSSRAPARVDATGDLVRLADQDRRLWRRDLIDEGQELVRRCLVINRPGPYQIQAAIAAVHADAPAAADTDWAQIVTLYNHLLVIRADPIVALNRAVAVLEHQGPAEALDLLDHIELPTYHLLHAIRAEALARAGRTAEAVEAIDRALALTSNHTERRHLEAQRRRLRAV